MIGNFWNLLHKNINDFSYKVITITKKNNENKLYFELI